MGREAAARRCAGLCLRPETTVRGSVQRWTAYLGTLGKYSCYWLSLPLLALGLLLFIISARAMVRLMYRLDHPDEPMPPWWQYRRGLTHLVEDIRHHYRYFRRNGFDANVVGYLGGFACFVAGLVLGENLDAVLDLFGWRLN